MRRPLPHLAMTVALLALAGCNQSQPAAGASAEPPAAAAAPAPAEAAPARPTTEALTLTPSRLEACEPGAVVDVRWDVRATHPEVTDVEIWTGAPGHQTIFAAGGYAGDASTVQPWAHPGTTFTLRNKADGKEITSVVVDGPACGG